MRAEWRNKLSDVDVRSMAYEYRLREKKVALGELEPDDCLTDAWLEYKERFGDRSTPHTEFLKKAKMTRGRNRKKRAAQDRTQAGNFSPLYNARGELL